MFFSWDGYPMGGKEIGLQMVIACFWVCVTTHVTMKACCLICSWVSNALFQIAFLSECCTPYNWRTKWERKFLFGSFSPLCSGSPRANCTLECTRPSEWGEGLCHSALCSAASPPALDAIVMTQDKESVQRRAAKLVKSLEGNGHFFVFMMPFKFLFPDLSKAEFCMFLWK